jgi:hypothetical protein
LKSESPGGRLSAQGRSVLKALATGEAPLPVAAVLEHIRRPDVAAPVARASLSRKLRRLWAAGLVELVTGHATRPTLTEQAAYCAYWRSQYVTAQASPDTAYQAYRRRFPTPADDFGSAAAYVDRLRVEAERPCVPACAAWRSRRKAARWLTSNSDTVERSTTAGQPEAV